MASIKSISHENSPEVSSGATIALFVTITPRNELDILFLISSQCLQEHLVEERFKPTEKPTMLFYLSSEILQLSNVAYEYSYKKQSSASGKNFSCKTMLVRCPLQKVLKKVFIGEIDFGFFCFLFSICFEWACQDF